MIETLIIGASIVLTLIVLLLSIYFWSTKCDSLCKDTDYKLNILFDIEPLNDMERLELFIEILRENAIFYGGIDEKTLTYGKRLKGLINMYADGTINDEQFNNRVKDLLDELDEMFDKIYKIRGGGVPRTRLRAFRNMRDKYIPTEIYSNIKNKK